MAYDVAGDHPRLDPGPVVSGPPGRLTPRLATRLSRPLNYPLGVLTPTPLKGWISWAINQRSGRASCAVPRSRSPRALAGARGNTTPPNAGASGAGSKRCSTSWRGCGTNTGPRTSGRTCSTASFTAPRTSSIPGALTSAIRRAPSCPGSDRGLSWANKKGPRPDSPGRGPHQAP